MKRKDLELELKNLGWRFFRHGGNHEVWTNGEHQVPVPRHNEINKFTAKGILRKAEQNPGKKK